MARYGVETTQSPEKVIERALAFFGEGGLGLKAVEQEFRRPPLYLDESPARLLPPHLWLDGERRCRFCPAA